MFIARDSKQLIFVAEDTNSAAVLGSVKILSYNVWFREDLEMHRRMKALGELIQLHSPDVICLQVFLSVFLFPTSWNWIFLCWLSSCHFSLQEVIPDIYDIFQRSSWWKAYQCSVSSEIASSRGYFCMQVWFWYVLDGDSASYVLIIHHSQAYR